MNSPPESVECSLCGRVPRLAKLNGDLLVICDCKTAFAVASSEPPTEAPSSWAEKGD